ncbi:MAG: hypothetical protein K6L80_15580 [Agarilytica sp.]
MENIYKTPESEVHDIANRPIFVSSRMVKSILWIWFFSFSIYHVSNITGHSFSSALDTIDFILYFYTAFGLVACIGVFFSTKILGKRFWQGYLIIGLLDEIRFTAIYVGDYGVFHFVQAFSISAPLYALVALYAFEKPEFWDA